MPISKKALLLSRIQEAQEFRFCGPSDDPDEQTAVTSGFRYLVTQIKRLAAMLPATVAQRLEAIDVEIDNIYSAYDARAELDALLPDIEAALEVCDDSGLAAGTSTWIVDPALVDRLATLGATTVQPGFLAKLCKEINSSFAHGNLLATALLMRSVLNYVPPVFGQRTFDQVVAQAGRSLKDSFGHLEEGLRKIADFHTHRPMRAEDLYPSAAQVEPYKPQFELLLQEVATHLATAAT